MQNWQAESDRQTTVVKDERTILKKRLARATDLIKSAYQCIFTAHQPPRKGGGGTRDFKWRGWSKSQHPKKFLGLPVKPQKIPKFQSDVLLKDCLFKVEKGEKFTADKKIGRAFKVVDSERGQLEHLQGEVVSVLLPSAKIKTKANGNSNDGKANWLNWSGTVEVLYTTGHHGTMQTIV